MNNQFLTCIASFTLGTLLAANAGAIVKSEPVFLTPSVVQDAEWTAPILTPFAPDIEPVLKSHAKIGFARLDKGRLIAAPMAELRNWAAYDARSSIELRPVSPAALLRNIPLVPMMGGRDSDNKIDEIRMTAADQGMDYVLIYGKGNDARWGSFGGKALIETGLIAGDDFISPAAATKAFLVDTYTGEIYGSALSMDGENDVRELVTKVEDLIVNLSTNTRTSNSETKDL
jgi:hypothetical protein